MINFTLPPSALLYRLRIMSGVIFLLTGTVCFGQLLQWNTTGNLGTETSEPSVFNDPNISSCNLTLGLGIVPAANGNRFGGSDWFDSGNTAGGNTLAEAIAGNNYIQFIVTPSSGSFTATSLVFNWDKSSSGPKTLTLRSSADGFTADLGTAVYSTIGTINTIPISGLINISTAVTFRLYGYGATGTSGTGGFDTGGTSVNVQLNGSTGPEINIKQGAASYATASTYDFGSQLIGSTTDVVFTIENLGSQSLTLGSSTLTGNPPYSLFANYSTPVASSSGTTTFTIRFSPTASGTITGSISIPNNDMSGSENPYLINFTGIGAVPAAEINVRGIVGTNPTIFSGDITPSGADNTQFAAQSVGNFQTKTFRIENTGTLDLNVSTVSLSGANAGDFSVLSAAPYVITAGTSVDLTITFAPTTSGLRTASVSISNDDASGGESPYTFSIEGTGNCAVSTNTITPTSGSAGTEVTITATANNLTGATVSLNGTALSSTQISSTQVKVTIPAGSSSGSLGTTNSSGCIASNSFTFINKLSGSCEGGIASGDLFFSEITDATIGGLTYIEIYNGTGQSVNLSNYAIKTYYNGSATPISTVNLNNVSLSSGGVFVLALGAASSPSVSNSCTSLTGGNGELANQVSLAGGINFDVGNNDHIALYNKTTALVIDVFGTYGSATWADALGLGDRGADFRRKSTAVLPTTTFSSTDWNITNWAGTGAASCPTNDYSNIGAYNFTIGIPPTVTLQPVYSPSCKASSLTVAGTEGFAGGNPLAYQWYGVAPNVANWTALTNTGVYSGATTFTLSISSLAGLDGYQFYCQIRENGGSCYAACNTVKIIEAQTTTWNGVSWSPVSPPTLSTIAVINGNYDTTINGSFDACSLIVNGGKTLTVSAAQYVNIQNDLTVYTTANLIVQNQGSLVMIDNAGTVTNSGSTQILKTTSPYEQFDYTYWSSPVSGNTIGSTFSAWRTDYSFYFNTANFADLNNDTFDDAAPYAWTNTGTATIMTPGLGYAIMAPTTGSFPTTNSVIFSGAVNNGVITTPIALSANAGDANDDYNLIGNPYPSALSATTFINNNLSKISGTLYFWTHVGDISASNPGPNAQNFISDDYAMFNLTGGTKASNTGSAVPTGYISSGEGFLIEVVSAGAVTFNNSMRSKTYNNTQFFRNSNAPTTVGRDRVWLDLENQDGLFSEQLIGYFDEATAGVDAGYDGTVYESHNNISFYSLIAEEKFRIQGKGSFNINDQVVLGYSTNVSGAFTVSIDKKEGAFRGDIHIYLEDKMLNVIHDLRQSPYQFTTRVGAFDNRFVLRYTNSSLGNDNFEVGGGSVVVAADKEQIKIRSEREAIADVVAYDVLGRVIFEAKGVGGMTFNIDKIVAHKQALIVKVRLKNNQVVSRKIIF